MQPAHGKDDLRRCDTATSWSADGQPRHGSDYKCIAHNSMSAEKARLSILTCVYEEDEQNGSLPVKEMRLRAGCIAAANTQKKSMVGM